MLQKIKFRLIGLIALVALLGAGTLVAISVPIQVDPEQPELSALKPQVLAVVTPPDNTVVIAQRPLFWEGRTPYVAPVKAAPEPVKEAPNTALNDAQVIAVFAAGDDSSVVIKIKDDVKRIALNELYQGWRLSEVNPNNVVFVIDRNNTLKEPSVKTIELNSRQPLPAVWQGEQQNYLESK